MRECHAGAAERHRCPLAIDRYIHPWTANQHSDKHSDAPNPDANRYVCACDSHRCQHSAAFTHKH